MRWADPGLLGLAVLAWAVVGAVRVAEIVAAGTFGARGALWSVLFLSFGACLVVALASHGRRALALTGAQSAIALAILASGMPRFEGALLAIAAAQFGLVTSRPVAWAWIVVQAIPLFASISLTRHVAEAARAAGEYLAFAAFAMMLFELRRREREQRMDLARVNADLLVTRKRLVESAQIGEQSRIQRELHDTLGHSLAVLSMAIDRAGQGPSSDGLGRARAALDALRVEVRAVLSGIEAPLDLRASLAALAAVTPSVRVRVDAQALGALDREPAWMVLRCAQEAITNAWKHGSAREVVVTSRAQEDRIVIRIENDGAPPPAPLNPGRGLRGMCDRAAAVGATVTFENGERFAVVVSVPSNGRATP